MFFPTQFLILIFSFLAFYNLSQSTLVQKGEKVGTKNVTKRRNFYRETVASLQTVLVQEEADADDDGDNDENGKDNTSPSDDEKVPEVCSLKLNGTSIGLRTSFLKLIEECWKCKKIW